MTGSSRPGSPSRKGPVEVEPAGVAIIEPRQLDAPIVGWDEATRISRSAVADRNPRDERRHEVAGAKAPVIALGRADEPDERRGHGWTRTARRRPCGSTKRRAFIRDKVVVLMARPVEGASPSISVNERLASQ
jgi:hypothetical protein